MSISRVPFSLQVGILLTAALALMLSESPAVVLICCAAGAAIGVYLLYQMAAGRQALRITTIIAAALLIGYCGGCAITQSFCGLDQSGVAGADWVVVPPDWIVFTIRLVLIASILLLCAAIVEPPLRVDRLEVTPLTERFLWIALIIVMSGIIGGSFGYEGTAAQEGTGRVSFLSDVSSEFLIIISPLAAIGALQSSGWRRLRFAFLLGAALLVTIPTGRRDFVYIALITAFAAARLSGVDIHLTRRGKWLTAVASIAVALLVSVVFVAIRAADMALGPGGHPLAYILDEAGYSTLADPGDVVRSTAENLEIRPFFLTQYLSLLTKGGHTAPPMHGTDAIFAAKMAVPDVIYDMTGHNKDPIRAIESEEGLANEHFGLPVYDYANSILTGGWIDFGLAGVLLYPLAVCCFWRLVMYIAGTAGPTARFMAVLVALTTSLKSEMELKVYLISARDVLIIVVMWKAISLIPRLTRGRATDGSSLNRAGSPMVRDDAVPS